MQKKLIALAVAGLVSGAAFAQTTVTLGGNVEVGYAGGENKSDYDNVKYKNTWSKFKGTDNEGWTSSQLTINVVEDLGNGLKAGYDHAIGLGIFAGGNGVDQSYSSGNNAAFQRTRMSRAYLASNNWGRLALGYQYTVEDQIQGIGRAGSGNLSNIGEAYNARGVKGYAAIGAGDITRANMFEYASPVWSGLQVIAQAGYTDDETTNKVNGIKTQDTDTEGQLYGLGLKYANGPLALGAAIQYSDPTSDTISASSETEKTTYILSGNYDFKVAKVFAKLFYRDGNQTDKLNGAKTVDADTTYKGGDIGVHVPFANRWKFIATAGMAKQEFDDNLSSDKGEYDIWGYQLALTYDFSKRTSVTAYWAQNKFEGDKDLDGQTDKRMVGGVGLKHSF